MRRLYLLVLLVACQNNTPVTVPVLSSPPPPMPVTPRVPATIRVMSYNVNFGLSGDPDGVAAIAAAHPDVVLLQETNPTWEGALRTLGYPHQRFGDPTGLPAGGIGVLSRFPIVAVEELPAKLGPFVAWRVVIDAPGGRIQIGNVHLRPPMSDRGSWLVGYFSTRDDRERELAWHMARLDRTLPTLIVGDFNEELDGLALRYATERGYTDAIAQAAGRRRTWEWPLGAITLRMQLDHILYDARFVAVAGGIVERGRSDHKPVWADLAIE